MKVFISWSGDVSHSLALALRDWLPSVLQSVSPFVSSEDVESGARWSIDIGRELEVTLFGLLCVTRQSVNAPWLNFEAGALSKWMDQSRVVPLLFRLRKSEIRGPLLQFNMRGFEKEDIKLVVETMNNACDTRIDQERLNDAFEVWWPRLEARLSTLGETASPTELEQGDESNPQVLEEILDLVRSQQKILNSPEALLPTEYLRAATRIGRPRISPIAVEELTQIWRSLFDLSRSVKPDETIPARVVQDYVVRLERPLSHILRHLETSASARSPLRRSLSHLTTLSEAMKSDDDDQENEESEPS